MKIGIVVYSNDSETVCSSFRFFGFSLVLKEDEEYRCSCSAKVLSASLWTVTELLYFKRTTET